MSAVDWLNMLPVTLRKPVGMGITGMLTVPSPGRVTPAARRSSTYCCMAELRRSTMRYLMSLAATRSSAVLHVSRFISAVSVRAHTRCRSQKRSISLTWLRERAVLVCRVRRFSLRAFMGKFTSAAESQAMQNLESDLSMRRQSDHLTPSFLRSWASRVHRMRSKLRACALRSSAETRLTKPELPSAWPSSSERSRSFSSPMSSTL
mmetsp:Transcript_18512/g.49762  ORF Transcript_18512/g.49762 Transcript_18512/m.49762 type:complete len:206 (-) Transcript_18512:78-695(-)